MDPVIRYVRYIHRRVASAPAKTPWSMASANAGAAAMCRRRQSFEE